MDLAARRFMHWEHQGRVYEWVGIHRFKWLLLHTLFGWLEPIVRQPGDLDRLLRELNKAEGVHWVGGGAALIFAVGFFLTG
jgi:hypothetical protein